MTLTRRKTLTLLTGGTVLAASAAAAGFLATRRPDAALAPWAAAGRYDDPRLDALSHALLAPNPHNRQPWVAALEGADGVTLWRDPTLDLPETDPFGRQLTIGMGCFIELMVMAAAERGMAVDLALFPDGTEDDAPVAQATFTPGGTPDPLFAHVFDRRSCKEPYDMTRRVDGDALQGAFDAAGGAVRWGSATEEKAAAPVRRLARDAFATEFTTPAKLKESIDLIRIGKREINAAPDGIDLQGPLFEVLNLAGQMTPEKMMDPDNPAYAQALDGLLATIEASPAFVWLATPDNTRPTQIAAGRAWVRLNLALTGAGLSLQPLSQALQEFPEMAEHYTAAHAMLAGPGETVQMLGRVGYGPDVAPAPRWPLEAKLKHG